MKTWLIVLLLALVPLRTLAIEEPDHQVVQRLGPVELRDYAPYVVAQVLIQDSAERAGNQAFPILAGYIFGRNKGERRLDMTAPVTQAAAPVTLEMTAPVTQAAAPGGFIVQFVLPKGVTLDNAPEPLDQRVQLREEPARRVAVIRYSGFWTQANYEEHLARLQAALREAGLRWSGEPVLSRYDPPIMPWFLRRNEIWLTLDTAPASSRAP
ncbi:MAG: heme-binding protein [Burkholderiales bacterium]|nr:heme-binding protein [Burkholderiales bacterium]